MNPNLERTCSYPCGGNEGFQCGKDANNQTECGKWYCDFHYGQVLVNRDFLYYVVSERERNNEETRKQHSALAHRQEHSQELQAALS